MGTLPKTYVHPELERYEEWTSQLAKKYPNLRNEDNHKRWYPRDRNKVPRIACIEYSSQGDVNVRRGYGAADFRDFYNNPKWPAATAPQRRLFILEEYDDQTKAAIGLRLNVDPQVFYRHSRIAMWERNAKDSGNTPPLTSLMDPRQTFMLEYSQLMHLNVEQSHFTFRAMDNERHIATSRNGDQFDGVGAVSRKISFWAQAKSTGGWDTMLIVDEPLRRAMFGDSTQNNVARHTADPEPFQGGYSDFIPYSGAEAALNAESQPRTSVLDDLCFYHEKHHQYLSLTADPRSVTLFAQKIVASEYMLLVNYHRTLLSSLGWRLSRRDSLDVFDPDWVEKAWSDLQSFLRRLDDHHLKAELVTSALHLDASRTPPGTPHFVHTALDFQHIEDQLQRLKTRADGLLSSFTSLQSIIGNRQSLDEARSVRVLTVLGMTFLPLSLVASLLSMGGKFMPGESEFWVYWAASIPSVLIVSALAWLAVHSLEWIQRRRTTSHKS